VYNRLNRPRGDAPNLHPLCILTVFESGLYRDQVRQWCAALAPASRVLDVSSATDAVFTLLTEQVDIVLIDAMLAVDMLGALKHHARRSSPYARLAVFSSSAAMQASSSGSSPGETLPWSELQPMVEQLLTAA